MKQLEDCEDGLQEFASSIKHYMDLNSHHEHGI